MATRFRLRELLEDMRLTQTDVQMQTGLAYSTINEMCNNRTRRIDFDTIEAICRALDCGVADIIEYATEKKHGRS